MASSRDPYQGRSPIPNPAPITRAELAAAISDLRNEIGVRILQITSAMKAPGDGSREEMLLDLETTIRQELGQDQPSQTEE